MTGDFIAGIFIGLCVAGIIWALYMIHKNNQTIRQLGGNQNRGVRYKSAKGALLGPGSGIKTAEQAKEVAKRLRGAAYDPATDWVDRYPDEGTINEH